MAVYGEGRGIAAEAEPFGLLTEGAAGIATIVLGVIALAGVSAGVLAPILIGGGHSGPPLRPAAVLQDSRG